eukprot:4654445-Amphidinium_carterae.1
MIKFNGTSHFAIIIFLHTGIVHLWQMDESVCLSKFMDDTTRSSQSGPVAKPPAQQNGTRPRKHVQHS